MNLTLAFDRSTRNAGAILATDRLSFGGVSRDALGALRAIAKPLAKGVEWFNDNGLVTHTNDLYGDQLTYVPAEQLISSLEPTAQSDWEKSVVTFVRNLPPRTRVVLWWH